MHVSNHTRGWIAFSRSVLVIFAGFVVGIQAWLLPISPAAATGVYNMPTLSAGEQTWILDEGDVLSRLNKGSLSGTLGNLAESTGNEVRLVTVHRLDYGETVETFTNALFDKWFPTPEEAGHQILLVLDTVTNKAAIRTGDAVKPLLTDDIANSVAQETLMVPLREGNRYNQAFLDVSDRLVAVLSGKPDPGPPALDDGIQTEGTFATPEETAESNATVWVIGLLLAATIIPMATYYLYQGMQG